jgi:hypothetical protein
MFLPGIPSPYGARGLRLSVIDGTRPGMVDAVPSMCWTPANLSSLRGWWKADVIGGCDNLSPVATWQDSSGRGNTGDSGGNSPDLAVANLNTRNVLSFTAANLDAFFLPSGIVSSFTEGSVFFVTKRNADPGTGDGTPASFFGTDAAADHYPFGDGNIYNGFLSTVRKTVGDPGNLAAWHIGSMQSKASDWRYAFNGVDFFTTATNTVGANTGAPLIGSSPGGHYYDGQIAEIILCNSFLTTDERQQVEGYLAWKWGLQAQLPITHAFYVSPPQTLPVIGASTLALSSIAAETAVATLAGSSLLTFASSGAESASGSLAGTTTALFTGSGAETAKGALAGTAALLFSPSAAETTAGVLTGTSTLLFTPSGAETARGTLVGTTAGLFTGSVAESAGGALVGSSTVLFSPTGTTTAKGSLVGASTVTLTTAGAVSASGTLAGTGPISFASSATLTGTAPTLAQIAGTTALTFSNAGNVLAFASLAGPINVTFAASGTGTAIQYWFPQTDPAAASLTPSAALAGVSLTPATIPSATTLAVASSPAAGTFTQDNDPAQLEWSA